MSEVIIKLENVSKFYKLYGAPKDRLKEALHPRGKKYHKPFYALRGLNLEIKKGDVLGVVGRNGSGKSTLLKLITGVLQPNEGIISVKGKVTALLELGAGFNPEFSGIDNIKFYTNILGISHQELEEKLPSIIAFAELGDFLHQPIKTYSSGMKARLGFAVAVHVDPEILILDEVLAVGDLLFRRKCYAKMEEFFKAGKTIIYVSHDANSVNQLCNRAVLIHEGDIIMDGEPKEVSKFYEKLLFSKSDKIPKIVDEIVANNSFNAKPVIIKDKPKQKSTDTAFFIEGLQPKATVRIENHGVEIFDPKIIDANGRLVNLLSINKNYTYKFKVRFPAGFDNVSFGSQVKTIDGVVLSGASLQNADENIESLKRGVYEFLYNFKTSLLPGDYYLDSSVSGSNCSVDYSVLARVKDILMFRVKFEGKNIFHGKTILNQTLDYRKVSDV